MKLCDIDGKTWKAAIDAVYVAALKKDETRPVLECVRIEANGHLRLVAADSYRLHLATIGVECDFTMDILANAQSLHKVKPGKRVSLAVEDDTLVINGEVLPLTLSTYPDYQQVIPTRFTWSFTIDAGELRQSVAFVGVMAKLCAEMVVVEDGFMSAASRYGEGDAFCLLETMRVAGTMPRMGFNYRYLADALRGESGQVTVSGNDATMPVLIVGQVAERVIMPMQLGR